MKELEDKNLIKLAIQANMKLFLSQDIINDYINDNITRLHILFHFLYAVNFKIYKNFSIISVKLFSYYLSFSNFFSSFF